MEAATMLKMAACCIVLVVFLSVSPPAMADIQDDCRASCAPRCDGLSVDFCNKVIDIAPVLKTLSFFFTTCKVRVSSLCSLLCVDICDANTVTPAPPASSPPPPPCTPH
ncbi:hypothetical protein HU200_049104 [Digitaria exilis]|uniref:Uncharacterized protein n=1 Tax=Digitaria exilis TaxID=1010633 RepID=A0A835EBI3_9POAL|nr:hypothetical protein HU200_049104 [Digitaria exilis]